MSTSNNRIQTGNSGFLCIKENRFLVEILGVDNNQIWTTFPGINYPLQGVGGHLEFHNESGFLAYNVQVLRYAERPETGIVLERSESAEQRTHRTSWRVPTDISVAFRTPNATENFAGILEDLSADGCQLRTNPVLAIRTPLELCFALDREHGNQIVEGRVCYVHEESGLQGGSTIHYGIKFTRVPPQTRRLLTLFLYHHVRKCYPRDVAAMYPRTRRRSAE